MIDIDFDKDLDIGIVSTDSFSWSEFNGQEFLPAKKIASFQLPQTVHSALNYSIGDFNNDGLIDFSDERFYFEQRFIGDSNGDGTFDSSDLVLVFQNGEYEDFRRDNSTFQEGDWNGDGEFSSRDLVRALQAGTYSVASLQNSNVAAAIDVAFADASVDNQKGKSV